MAPNRVVEAVDVSGNVPLCIGAGEKGGPLDQFGFQRLEECLDHRIVSGSSPGQAAQLPLPDIEIRMPWRRSVA
jgi:hypothetical protein